MALDFYADAAGDILRLILEENKIPDCVAKCATLIPSEELRGEHARFAWPARQLFAIDTPQDVWLSAAYFDKTAHRIPHQHRDAIGLAIKEAALLYDVQIDEPTVKEAFSPPDEAFLIVVSVDPESTPAKRASNAILQDDGSMVVRLYPVHDAEHVTKSALWFPRDLVGDLAYHRPKVAKGLLEACKRFGVDPGMALIEEVRPIKQSSLIAHLSQRIGLIQRHNKEAAKAGGLRKAARRMGVLPPYDLGSTEAIDDRSITVYGELLKMAHRQEVDRKFWDLLERIDSLAKIARFGDLAVPAASLDREVDYDIQATSCKLAGTLVSLLQVIEKVPRTMWDDLAPGISSELHDLRKVASTVEGLSEISQRAIMACVRGY